MNIIKRIYQNISRCVPKLYKSNLSKFAIRIRSSFRHYFHVYIHTSLHFVIFCKQQELKQKTMEKEGEIPYKKGLWTMEEDKLLIDYVKIHGKGQWNKIANRTGLRRCGKSCRLRWMNYLSPNVKKGGFSDEEEDLVIRLHKLLGNRWSLIAKRVPGRTDNQVKNFWNSHLRKKLGIKDQNKQRVDFCQSSEQVKVYDDDHHHQATMNPSPGDGTTSTETMEITVDQSNQQEAVEHRVLNDAQESMVSESYINTFWIPDDDYELSTFAMIDHFDEYSSFHIA